MRKYSAKPWGFAALLLWYFIIILVQCEHFVIRYSICIPIASYISPPLLPIFANNMANTISCQHWWTILPVYCFELLEILYEQIHFFLIICDRFSLFSKKKEEQDIHGNTRRDREKFLVQKKNSKIETLVKIFLYKFLWKILPEIFGNFHRYFSQNFSAICWIPLQFRSRIQRKYQFGEIKS